MTWQIVRSVGGHAVSLLLARGLLQHASRNLAKLVPKRGCLFARDAS